MEDLKITSKSPEGFQPGKLDVRFSGSGDLETLQDDEQDYIQNLMKATLDAYRDNGYGVEIASFRGQKDSSIARVVIQNRLVNSTAFLNRFYPLRFKVITTSIIPTSNQLLIRIVLDQATLQLSV